MNERKVTESVAVDLLKTQAANVALNQELEQTSERLEQTQETLKKEKLSLEGELADSRSKIGKLSSEKELLDALEASRQEFSESEAEMFIQDGKLVVRLKEVNFPFGKSDLPSSSLPSLVKVRDIIKELNSKDVVVEGHTDSIGQRAYNKDLSEQRASTVATFFKDEVDGLKVTPVGQGESKPIASNETKQGRAQNRRVDVIITPSP